MSRPGYPVTVRTSGLEALEMFAVKQKAFVYEPFAKADLARSVREALDAAKDSKQA